ncbi:MULTISPECIES: glycoside hydrolase 43 family protein [Actinoalloteichus]|nr:MULTISPECIES: glycoside hydrolase 43 family protein [Actinoalloteichus]
MSSAAEEGIAAPSEDDGPPWQADQGDGTYRNPVLCTDLSDPDVIRVGDDFHLVASTFAAAPGLTMATSRNLVDWRLTGHALPAQEPADVFARPQPGKGVWAPSLRFHAGRYHVFYGDPDFGIRVLTATRPDGPWSAPHLIKAGRGLIDPCPLWDADGSAYLVHGWAASRSGISNRLTLHRMSPDATELLDEGRTLIDGDEIPGCHTLEGPKLYRREGWYYVFAPAGGVATGWQSVFRARSIDGPYEHRIVLAQRDTEVNGPHQGAWVDTPTGEDWFLHFQDRGVYGRVVHLQPMSWGADGWPVIGVDPDENGCGRPVLTHPKPALPAASAGADATVPSAQDSVDERFTPEGLGPQWSWQANPVPSWFSLTEEPGALRLFARPDRDAGDLRAVGQVLTRRWPAEEFAVTVDLRPVGRSSDEQWRGGLAVLGDDYAWLGVVAGQAGLRLVLRRRLAGEGAETELAARDLGPVTTATLRMRLEVSSGGRCRFGVADGDGVFHRLGTGPDASFAATAGRWVGAKVGVFAVAETGAGGAAASAPGAAEDSAYLAVDRIVVTALRPRFAESADR